MQYLVPWNPTINRSIENLNRAKISISFVFQRGHDFIAYISIVLKKKKKRLPNKMADWELPLCDTVKEKSWDMKESTLP